MERLPLIVSHEVDSTLTEQSDFLACPHLRERQREITLEDPQRLQYIIHYTSHSLG